MGSVPEAALAAPSPEAEENLEGERPAVPPPSSPIMESSSALPSTPRDHRKPRRCSELICEEYNIGCGEDGEGDMEEATASFENKRPPSVTNSALRKSRQKSCLMELGEEEMQDLQQQVDVSDNEEEDTPRPRKLTTQRSSSFISAAPNEERNNNNTTSAAPRHTLRELSYHPSAFQIYQAPRQRQEWGQKQILPRVNWGDLFFDLFYVAAAYNASNILVEDPTSQGFLYFLATFLSVQQIWMLKMGYDARYVVSDDLVHRFQEIISYVILASVVVHIRPLGRLENSTKYMDMFDLALSLTVSWAFQVIKFLELYFFGQGQRTSIQGSAFKELKLCCIGFGLCLAAAIMSGMAHFGSSSGADDDVDGQRRFLAEADPSKESAYNNTTDDYTAESNYATASYYPTTNVPIILILCAPVVHYVALFVQVIFLFPNDGSHKNFVVPMNVDFSIHRYAEWTMLMLGESILSLLIVDVNENSDYFATFYCSLLTVIFLQYLHFRSMPHEADDHAMRRSKNRGMAWIFFKYVYSCALVALGAAFALFVTSFSYELAEDGTHRRALNNEEFWTGRFLAGGGGSLTRDEFDAMEQSAANLFSIALSVVFIALDGMSFMNVGFEGSKARCQCQRTDKYNIKGVFVIAARAGLLVFCATLSQWKTDPQLLAEAGLGITIGQIIMRKLGMKYLNKNLEQVGMANDQHHGGAAR